MKERIVIFGTSEFSEYVYHTIKKEGDYDVLGFTVDKDHFHISVFNSLPVFILEELPTIIAKNSFSILITVGYTNMNRVRKVIYEKCKNLGYKVATYVSSRAICDTDSIGEGCIVMPMAYVPPQISLGICSVVNTATILGHTSVIGNYNWFSGSVIMGGNVIIDDYCFFGMNSLLKNGIHVANQSMIAAYSYLNDDTEEGLFYSGNPANNIKKLKSVVVCEFI